MRMNWRLAGGLLGGLLLAAPLGLLVAITVVQRPPTPATGAARLSPVLTEEERRQLITYGRDCVRPADCEAPLSCLSNTRARRTYCTDSACETEAQCPERFACVALRTVGDSPLVRFCVPEGLRKEGESCIAIPETQADACAPGLRCADGWCGRPCQLDVPASCPAGFYCADFPPGPTCRPTCEGRTCPAGQQCMHDDGGASVCAVVYGSNCQRVPCAEGKRCLSFFATKTQVAVWLECSPACDDELPPCPAGQICTQGSCLKPCDPNGPNVCDEGFRCHRWVKTRPWACWPDME